MEIDHLRCEYMKNPCGVDTAAPVFSWQCLSDVNGDGQTAYQIIVFHDDRIVWDSGVVNSRSHKAEYEGSPLESSTRYYWKVGVTSKSCPQWLFSERAFFDTGILHNEWRARWICRKDDGKSLPVFLKSFSSDKKVKRAIAFISAPGMFEFYINDRKANEALFEPGETCFDKKALYSAYDVTDKICPGQNKLLIYLGKGFYYNTPSEARFNRVPKQWGKLMLLCQLEIEYADGTKEQIATDETWHVTDGPLTESCWLGGEDYDARLEENLFDPSVWEKSEIVAETPFQYMEAKKYPPVKAMERFDPVSVVRLDNGDCTVDFGTNFAGIYSFKATAERGRKIYFYPAENVNDDRSVNQDSSRFGKHNIYDTYTFAGKDQEGYTPKFVYHGMRYLQISGIDVTTDMICGYAVHCANEKAGSIETSDRDINRIDKIINRSVSDNMFHVITDCPHREKLGWLEVPHLLYNTIADHYNIAAYMRKITADLCDAQAPNGSVPSIVPPFTTGLKEHALRNGPDLTPNDPIWCGAIVMLPFYSYQRYGDIELLRKTFPAMNRYMRYLSGLSDNCLIESSKLNRDLGDWVSVEKTSETFAVSCMYYQLAHTMEAVSAILDCRDEEAEYSRLSRNIKNAINGRFFDRKTQNYDTGSQTANALPIFLEIVSAEYKNDVLNNLLENVTKNNYHITAGEYGMRPLLNVLSENGYCGAVYRMLTNETPPSYKYFIDSGKTSLPEIWSGEWSQNHCILGHGGGWLYEYLGGIRNVGTAFDKILIEPYFPDQIQQLSVSLETMYGTVSNNWHRTGETINMRVSVPMNACAKICIPSGRVKCMQEEAVKMEQSDHKTILLVESGKYELTFLLN